MIKRGRISVLMLLLAIAFVFLFGFNQKAKAESGLVDLTYEDYEGVTPKLISYSDCTLFVTIDDQEFQFEFDSTKKGDIFFVSGDANGTIWINIDSNLYESEPELYFISYELEGNEMSLHYFNKGYMKLSTVPYVGTYASFPSEKEYNLPNLDELSKLLNNPNTPAESSQPSFSTSPVIPTETPSVTVSPTKKPIPTKAPTSTPKVVKGKISKSKKTKTKVCLLSNTGKVLKEVKFNKKTGVMVYNKKKIKKVKDVFFTKKGTVVYFTKSKKAYYFIGKKRILIKSKVSSVKTYKGFATQLVIKKGKKTKSIKLKK
mgnify:FL=1